MRPVSLRLSRSTPGICSVKWRGIPWHANDAFVVGKVVLQKIREEFDGCEASILLRLDGDSKQCSDECGLA